MRGEKLWSFVKDNVLSLITVTAGIVVLVLHEVGMVTPGGVGSATLALVALLATSEIVERQRRLAKLEGMLQRNQEALARGIDALAVQELSAPDAFEYFRFLLLTAQKSVFWAATEPRRGSAPNAKRPYEDAIDAIVRQGQVQFTYVSCFSDRARVDRALRLLSSHEENPRLYIGYVPKPPEGFPAFSFLICDECVMITRAPYAEGTRGKYLAIRSRTTIELFLKYFEVLLEGAMRLESPEQARQVLANTAGG
jgi:hypothetical protein